VIAIDTNLLVYAHNPASPQRQAAQVALNRAAQSPQGWGIALPSMVEFWSIVTRRGNAEAAAAAAQFIEQLQAAGAQVWLPQPGIVEIWRETAQRVGIRGVEAFDLQIALIVQARGASEIWTHDRNFTRLPGLLVVDPILGTE
jgi:hypothetical protein